jgi:heme-degrading monooxygenase HmoA
VRWREQTTFVTISWWESVEAMTRFTGGDPRQVHHLERDPEFLVALPERVEILDVKTTFGFPPAPGSPPDRDRPSRRLKIAHTIVI